MLTEEMRRFIESNSYAFVASSNKKGHPHLAAGRDLLVRSNSHIVFEAWLCHTTMENITENPRVAVVVTTPEANNGYQFGGVVESSADTAIMDGYIKGGKGTGIPHVQYRL